MNRSNAEIEASLKRAIEAQTPDVLDKILLQAEKSGGNDAMNETASSEGVLRFPKQESRKKTKTSLLRRVSSVAAAFLVAVGLYAGYIRFTPEAVIGFDVNPSIELSVNRAEKVLKATPLNEDGSIVLGDMDLKNVDLNVAVNAVIGSMVKNGYINEAKNSILISVDSNSGQKGEELQKRLSEEVDSLLSAYSLNAAVMSQTVTEDERLKALAEEHGISLGKAALVELLVEKDALLRFEDMAKLSINDINLLIAAKQADITGMNVSGEASAQGYIGEENALLIACSHAGVEQNTLKKYEVKLDYDDGKMVYDVEFDAAAGEYEYEIDALDGTILDYEQELHKKGAKGEAEKSNAVEGAGSNTDAKETRGAHTGARVNLEKAKEIVLAHAGLRQSDVRFTKAKPDEDDGRIVYEIEFTSGGTKYEYEVDAGTGAVLSAEQDED